MNRILSVLCVVAIGTSVARSGDLDDAEQTVKEGVDGVMVLLRDKDLDRNAKRDKIMEVIEPMFDFALMAKLTLGKSYWPKLDPEQQKEFKDLFVGRLQGTYMDKAEMLSDETVEFSTPVQVKSKVQVKTSIRSTNEVIDILYKLYKRGSQWRVYDLEIQGVSIVSSYRAEYVQILREGGAEDLLQRMRDKAVVPQE